MTNSDDDKKQLAPRSGRHWWRILLLSGTGVGILGLVGAVAAREWVQKKLAPLVASEVSQTLKRPVQIGRLERFSPIGLRFGRSTVPATAIDPDYASTEAVEVKFSIWPLLFSRTLKLDITLVKPSAYIEQDAEGRWVDIPTQDKKPAGLFKTEIEAIRVENAGAVLVPSPEVGQKTSAPISVTLKNGSALFREQNQRVLYELNGQFTNNDNFAVKADSLLPAAQTNVLLQSQNLPLSDITRLLKVSGISLQKGLANSNLTVQVRDNKLSGITGTASFAGVQASIKPLKQIIQNGSGQLRFQGTNLIVDTLTGNYGLIPVQIAGTVATGTNFNTEQASFNLITNVQPVAVASIVSAVEAELGQKVLLPIAVAGEVKADAKLTGTVANPVLSGTIASTKPATVDRLQLNNISTNFKLERGRTAQTPTPNSPPSTVPLSSLALTLSDILVVPAAGGKIGGKGEVDITLGSENSRSGLVFDLQAENLPADAIAQIYALPIPAAVKIGSVSAKAQVFGPLNNIQARAKWQAPQGTFPASGEIRAGGNTADLQNTVVKIGDATVNVDAAIQDRQWEAIIKGDRVAVKSLQPLIPRLNLPPELAGLFSGTAEVAGTLDDLSLNGIYASGKGTLNVVDSIVDVNAKLESGRWQASGKTEKVAINPLLDIGLPFLAIANSANLDNLKSKIQNLKSLDGQLAGEFQAAGNLDNLTASGINLSTNGKLNIADSSVNLKGELTDGNWQATAETDRTSISRLVDLTLPILDVASAFNPENQPDSNLRSKIQNLKSIDGQLSSQFTASGSLENLTASAINLNGSGKLNLGGNNVNFKGELAAGNWQGTAETDRTSISSLVNLGLPLLDVASAFNPEKQEQYSNLKSKIQNLKSLDGQISNQIQAAGSLDKSSVADVSVNSSGKLNIADGTVDFKGKLDAGQWQAVADLDRVILSRLEKTVRNLQLFTLTATLPKGFDGRVNGQYQAAGSLDNLTAKGIRASGEGRILVDRLGAIDTTAKLENGNLEASLATNGVTVSNLEQTLKQTGLLTTNLPREIAGTLDGKIRIVGNTDNLTANGITANGDGQIRLANGGGVVNAKGSAQSGNWRASIEGDQIALSRFQKAFEAQRQSLQGSGLVSQAQNLPLLRGLFNGNVDLSGPIAAASPQNVRAGGSFRISELPFLKQPFDAIFNWDGKRIEVEKAATRGLTASGFVGVELAGKGLPSISNLDLDVKLSNFNLEALPAEQLAFLTPMGAKKSSEKNQPVRGNVDFTGRLTGTLAALSLVGDVEVRNLAVNQVAFDSVLAGKVTASSDKSVDLRLAGPQDKIEVALNQSFLPTSFLVKRGESVARGQAEGETLRVNLSDFPLAALNLSPGEEAGLGPITGTVSGQVNVPGWKMPLNPATLQANGQIAIAQPAIGYIKGDSFQAEFSYANGSATLTNGIFRQGTGQYSISGNVKAGANPEFAGKVNIQQGNLQQVLAALRYFNLGDFARGLKPPVYGNSGDVKTVAVGEPEAPLIEQLRRLAEIEVILQQQQAVKSSEKLPALSQLQGTFGGEIAVAGSLRTGVQAQFNVKGDNWQWGKYVAEQFSIEGSFQDGILTVLPLEIRSGKSAIGFSGQLGQKAQSGQLRVENVPVEELAKLIELPFVDVTGNLNLRANLAGSLENPQATGELSLLDGTLNGEPIKKADSSFSYSNARLNFGGSALVTQTEPIEVQGSLPFELPFAAVKPDNNQIDFRANLQNEGLAIINVLTPQLAWVNGKGQVQIRVGGTLQQPVAQGIANFENATVRARAFPEPLTGVTGTVRFEGDRIRVEGIRGQLSKGEVVAQGVIPLSVPFAEGDVDAANPLAVNLDKLGLNLRGLYRGGAVGQVQARGTALRPQLSGKIELYDGEVFLPSAGGGGTRLASSDSPSTTTSSPTTPTEVSTSPATPTSPTSSPSFEVGLNDLALKLGRGVRVTSAPILNFQATGALTVNGTLDDIRPAGTIRLTSGAVNLFTTQFKLDKGYPQTATFVPTQGLDPTLDVRLATSVQEVSRFRTPGTSVASEIADEPTSFGSVRSVRIQALVKGKASQLAENIELRSSPGRSQTEIVALLGGSFVQTLGQGDSTLAIANLAGAGLFNNLQSVITNATGLSEFRLFPTRIRGNEGQTASSSSGAASGAGSLGIGLEVGADITRNLSASIIRVLSANQPTEFNVRYRLNDKILLRGSTNFQGDNRVTAEYELRF
ncbi:MAG: translocation/assembly module TamB domain-containing protein [Microcoleus sp. PH2017_39_LGB_O_B]|uniref:translocation/assembly module TamB domain-containing protein n=1 Tax=unclassified Microcoleus TaxID=2642155 RepID=UPI001DE58622|nr:MULTISPECIES: translocation/assembly module TamB [unclassified Microcoleus]MCC3449614.1 translocation/assembly module TamB domain-containing protein [Microcoleus sp. PH2017_09_SFU_O_A]MCC3630500.1 translocation/assembly module TamB domain-containing protein [Microcoleus sp. PH2017_39_LGB_O_B]MCC3642648.1 translocation/assembly module TamB domain-containing protein [Microcoleus sp. PH2017_33_LGB_O_A]TAF88705.1 MAG: translocation/assembly module TamB [Oscillatoriales cyanobacterium]